MEKTYLPMAYYKVTVTTGDRRGAGTDSNVFVIITGENGDTGKRFLTGSGNLFERNSKDEFGIDCVDLGMIKKIEIGHDGWGFGSDWFLEKVVVKSDTLQKDFFFLFGDWINGEETKTIEPRWAHNILG